MTDDAAGASAIPEKPKQSLGRASAVMASGTAVSRALGLVRNAVLVLAIGVSADAIGANAYDIANKLPNAFFAILAAGVLNAALVPQIVKAFQRAGGKQTVDRILTIGGVVTLGATLIFTLTAQVWVQIYTQDWTPQMIALATAFAYWCIPQLFFYGLYTLLGQVLNSRSQFGPFMWAPVLNNVIAIAGLVVYLMIFGPHDDNPLAVDDWTPGGIALIGAVATAGIAAQALILIIPMVRGGYRWNWRWRGPKGELTVIGRVAAWALAAVAVEQVGVALTTRVAAAAVTAGGESDAVVSNAAYFQALGLYLVPHSLITISLATAMYTAMAGHAARGDMAGLRRDLSHGLRTIGVFTVFATAAMLVLAPYVVTLAMPSISGPTVTSISYVLMALVIGLVPLGATVLFKRVYFVLEDAKSIFFMHIPMTLAWVAVAYGVQALTDPRWWTVGVGLGLAASNTVGVILRASGLRRLLGGLDGRRVLTLHAKAAIAAVVAAGVTWPLLRFAPRAEDLEGMGGIGGALAVLAVAGTLMLGIYVVGLLVLKVPEARDTARPLLRRMGRG